MSIKFRTHFRTWALVIALSSTPALAQDYVINVNDIVCEFCSLGVTKKVSKLQFIDRSKYTKGVKVEIESQIVTIAVKTDTALDKAALSATIESGGYNLVGRRVYVGQVSSGDFQAALSRRQVG
jgi:hypothetical protein